MSVFRYLSNVNLLAMRIESLAESVEAVEDGVNEYGIFYRVEGDLNGINGVNLSVVTIWLQRQSEGNFSLSLSNLVRSLAMTLELYKEVALTLNLSEHQLRAGHIATLCYNKIL